MLQRAASNAYSWWWASHIRTKQSKWLEQNLQDMGEKVQNVLKLIEEDGDSFARRAEMYYKKRPELIHFVEESYRAYRALAERYDHISTELQNANNTIAYVFPEQVAFAMEEDEDEAPRIQKKPGEESKGNIPKVPKIPKDIKGVSRSAVAQKFQSKMSMKATNNTPLAKSGLNKDEGLQEIDRLQKQILALQTEKEFAKSSYEGGLAKYWEIEQQIREMQDRIGTLQDEFGAGTVIEDDEARTLMASAALKSCQETLALLQQKQEKSAEEAIVERRRINDAREKLTSLKNEFLHGQIDQENPQAKDESVKAAGDSKNMGQEVKNGTNEKQDLELLREKIKEHFEVDSGASLTVTELAEKIDELVNKVIGLEAAISSQTALIQRLRMETYDLQAQILTLEADKASLINGKNDLSEMLREMEGKLRGLHQLDKSVEEQKNNLQTHFTQAQCNLDHLSEKLHNVKPDEELPVTLQTEKSSSVKVESLCNNPEELQNVKILDKHEALDESQEDSDAQEGEPQSGDGHEEPQNVKLDQVSKVSDLAEKKKESPAEVRLQNLPEGQEKEQNQSNGSENVSDNKTEERGIKKHDLGTPEIASDADNPSETSHDQNMEKKIGKHGSRNTLGHMLYVGGTLDQATSQDEEPDWKQLFINGLENREKTLLTQYTTLLRNFKDVKVKLSEAKNKSSDSLFDTTVQLREMKSANAKKDEQIRYLRQKLSLLQSGLGKDNESEKSMIDSPKKEETEDIKALLMEEPETSGIEAKFRMDIDEVLEENLDFWLRFSTTIHQIQKFETEIQDLEAELLKIEEKQKHDGSSTSKYSVISDAKPLYKHLREIHTELSVWLDKSMVLKDELKSRFSSLCNIQEEITTALKESAEDDDLKFTSYQAAKFQGEILNMKQENNKVADELQAGLDNVTTLQLEVEKTLAKMNEEFKLSGSKNRQNNQLPRSESRSRVPLRSFIFGTKAKKQKNSIFSCMHPTLHRKYNGFRPHM